MRVCNFKKLQKSQSQSLGPNLRDFHFEATILSILYISTENLLPTCTTQGLLNIDGRKSQKTFIKPRPTFKL